MAQIWWVIWFVFRHDSSSSDQDDAVAIPRTDDLLRPPSRQEQEEQKQANLAFQDSDKIIQVKDLEHQAASDKLEKQIDAQRKSNDDWKRRRDQNEEPKRIFQTKLTRYMIREVFNNEIDLLENIRTGKKSSARHKMFKTSAQSCQALGQQNYTHILSKEQVQWVCEEMDKKWMDQDYNWKVLVPEFCVSLYAHFFNTSREIAERKILETGAGIYGLTRSSSG